MRHRALVGVAAASLLVGACQGSNTLSKSGAGGAGGQSQPAKAGASGSDRDGGLAGNPQSGGGAGGAPDAGGTTACKPLGPIPRRLWRLSVEQWGNAVQSLLSLPSRPALHFTGGEPAFAPFSDATTVVDAAMLYDMYGVLGDATNQIDPMVGLGIAPCTGDTADAQTACASSFVQAFAAQAYRRPLDPDELSDLMAVFQDGADTSYNAGIELVMKAVLASPSFLFRTELGPRTLAADASGNYPDTTLTPDEIATQLSFTLLGNLPDAPLTAAAADGSLATKDGIAAQVNRLIAAPAAQTYVTETVLRLFGVNQLFGKVKDPTLLSALSSAPSAADLAAIQADLWTSAQQFVRSILWTGSGKVDDLFTSQAVYVNRRLATLYPDAVVAQAPASDATFVAATWPASEGRSGLLTQPSYLWALSDSARTSIVIRGKAIHDNILCQDPAGTPIDLSTPEAVNVLACKSPDGTKTLSTCDSEILQSDARLSNQPCQTCHAQIDPYARVLQNFGPSGNYRTLDESGRPIDPVATFVPGGAPLVVPGVPGAISVAGSPLAPRTVTGAQELASASIATGVLDGCAVQQLVGDAIGSPLWTYDTCELGPLRAASDGTIKSLLVNVLVADFMRARAGGPK